MSENNDNSSESNSKSGGGDSILQASRFGNAVSGGNPLIRSGVLRPSVLGPSVLGSSLGNAAAAASAAAEAKAKDEVIINPFMKEQKDAEDEKHTTDAPGGAAVGAVIGDAKTDEKTTDDANDNKANNDDDEEPDDRPDPLSLLRKNGLERANLFAAAKSSIPRVEKSGFVFGQNVHERVVGDNISGEQSASAEKTVDGTAAGGGLLFASVIQNAAKSSEAGEGAAANAKESDTKSLTDVAREYEESRAQKRKYEEVETFTGEENEVNIVDVSCKLFAFVNSNWEERGRGSLRVNDPKKEQDCSRVVFRTSGNLRLLLNTKVWAGMVAERPSQKSLRLTAMDNTGKIKIFLAMARPVDINQLHKALTERIDKRKATHPEECRTAVVVDENHCDEESKNGAVVTSAVLQHPNDDDDEVDEDEQEEDAVISLAVPVVGAKKDDLAEPSPKKSIIAAENI